MKKEILVLTEIDGYAEVINRDGKTLASLNMMSDPEEWDYGNNRNSTQEVEISHLYVIPGDEIVLDYDYVEEPMYNHTIFHDMEIKIPDNYKLLIDLPENIKIVDSWDDYPSNIKEIVDPKRRRVEIYNKLINKGKKIS